MITTTIRKPWLLPSMLVLMGAAACQDLNTAPLPAGVQDPVILKTEEGALALYHEAVQKFDFMSVVIMGGLLTDELQAADILGAPSYYGPNAATWQADVDALRFTENLGGLAGGTAYESLQQSRAQASLGMGALAKYATRQPADLRGHLHALTGYAAVGLADVYCSGIPLSTLDFEGDFTYQPGSVTRDVYEYAVAHFDTALTLLKDSVTLLNLARVGKGRALLALGRYADASAAVRDVPTNFVFQLTPDIDISLYFYDASVSEKEGTIGLPYVTWNDPRTPVIDYGPNIWGRSQFAPRKYVSGAQQYTVASGIEARLIEAESELAAGQTTWLSALNMLRTDGTYTVAGGGGTPDTSWNAGSGGVAGLRPLKDAATDSARVDLIFRERAAWLFVTGHHQGDLRRLMRNYLRKREDIYPSGSYPAVYPEYGPNIDLPLPVSERINPLYKGCLSRGA